MYLPCPIFLPAAVEMVVAGWRHALVKGKPQGFLRKSICHSLPHPHVQQVVHGVSETHAAVLEKKNQPLHFSDLLLQYRSFHHLTLLPDLVVVDLYTH